MIPKAPGKGLKSEQKQPDNERTNNPTTIFDGTSHEITELSSALFLKMIYGGETNCRNKCVWNMIGTSLCPANFACRTITSGLVGRQIYNTNMIFEEEKNFTFLPNWARKWFWNDVRHKKNWMKVYKYEKCENDKIKNSKTAKTWNNVIMVILDWWANLDEQMLSYMCNICETVKQQLGGQDECNRKAGNCAIARRAKWNSTLELLRDSGHCHLCNNPKLGFKSTASKFKQL